MESNAQESGSRVEVRHAKSEVLAWWLFGGTLAVLIILLIVKYLDLPLWLIVMIGLILLIVLLYVLRSKPEPDMYAVWDMIREKEYTASRTIIPRRPSRMEAKLRGKFLIFFFWNTSDQLTPSSIVFDLEKRGVYGREIKHMDAIAEEIEQSQIMSSVARAAVQKQKMNEALVARGFEPDDVEGEPDE